MKKVLAYLLAGCMAVMLAGCGSTSSATSETAAEAGKTTEAAGGDATAAGQTAAEFPKDNINLMVPFGAGGGTDNLARPIAANVEKNLGVSLVINNVTGASGATGSQQIAEADPDGYNLLFTAENICIYDAMDISDLSYEDFDPLMVFGSESVCLIVKADSEYQTITDLIEYAKANPNTVTKPVAGVAGLAAIVDSLIYAATGAQLVQVPSDGDADALVQLMGGEVTCALGKLSTISSYLESGDVRALCTFTTERLDLLPDVPAITEEYPAFETYLPWGSFYGVYAPKGTPEEVKEVLINSFKAAAEAEDVQQLFSDNAIEYLGLTGDEAVSYLENYRKNVCSALIEAGTVEKTLEELGIQ